MQFRVLGPLEVDTGDVTVSLASGRVAAVLACLLLSPRQVITIHRIAEDVWGAEAPADVPQTVQTNVARLRRMLGPSGSTIVTRPPGYLLAVDDDDIDAEQFERLCREARRVADPAAAVDRLDTALRLWRGEPFGEFASTFASAAAARLEELRVSALEDRAAAGLRLGEVDDAIARAGALVSQHGFRERPVSILMRALYESGRSAEALEAYRRHRTLVADELGIDPSPALSDLEGAILRGELPRDRHAVPLAARAAQPTGAVTPAGAGLDPRGNQSADTARSGTAQPTRRPSSPERPLSDKRPPPGDPDQSLDPEPVETTPAETPLVESPPFEAPPPTGRPGAPTGVAPISTPRADLPIRPSPLIGRDAELASLASTLESARLTTLVGPGGVGKTRIALEAAHGAAQHGRRVWWLDLVPVTADRLVDALAALLNVQHRSDDEEPVKTVLAKVEAHRGLLVLDNAEHLLEPLAPLVERLTEAAPGLALLITSRERLALDAEAVRALSPLPMPHTDDPDNPSVQLFLTRARLDAATLAPADLHLVTEACRRLDGLPLAIELAAARVGTLGLPALLSRLGERLDLLGGGRRTSAERHQTLRRVIDWSFALLAEPEAELLARLSVFPSRFSLEQAEDLAQVAGSPRAYLDASLARLVEQSLVQSDGRTFWLLETVRAYARERLPDADTARLRARHAAYVADRLAAGRPLLSTAQEPQAVATLAALEPDLIAAWDHARAHDQRLGVRLAADIYEYAYFRQRLELLSWATTAVSWDVPDHPDLPRALASAASSAWARGHLDEARAHVERAIALAGGPHAPSAARAVDVRADLDMFEGRTAEAIAGYRVAAESYRRQGEEGQAVVLDVAAGQAASYGPDRRKFTALVPELLRRAEELDIPSVLAFAYFVAGEYALDRDADEAFELFDKSVAYGRRSDCRLFVMMARTSAVGLMARAGNVQTAFELFNDVIGRWEEIGNQTGQWRCLCQLVVLFERAGHTEEAAALSATVDAALARKEAAGLMGELAASSYNGAAERLRALHPELANGPTLTIGAAVDLARRVIATARAVDTRPGDGSRPQAVRQEAAG